MKRVIRSNKPVTLLLLLWSHKCDFGAEPKSRIIATSAVKGLRPSTPQLFKVKVKVNYDDKILERKKDIMGFQIEF
jgi:hypothetical protein